MKNKFLFILLVCMMVIMGAEGYASVDIGLLDYIPYDLLNNEPCEHFDVNSDSVKIINLTGEETVTKTIKGDGVYNCDVCNQDFTWGNGINYDFSGAYKMGDEVIYKDGLAWKVKVCFSDVKHMERRWWSDQWTEHDLSDKVFVKYYPIKDYGFEMNKTSGYFIHPDTVKDIPNEYSSFLTNNAEGDLILIAFDPNKYNLYFEINSPIYWEDTANTGVGGMIDNCFSLAKRIDGYESEKGDKPCVFLCNECSVCDAYGCTNDGSGYIDEKGEKNYTSGIASNGFTVAGQYGIEEPSLRVSKYCWEHTCGFFWETVNGGRAAEGVIQSIEGLSCDKNNGYDADKKNGSLFCTEHTCQAGCSNPIIGVNILDGSVQTVNNGKRIVEVQTYTGNEFQYYSKFCVKHFCWEYNCKEERRNPDRSGKVVDGANSKDFCNYCVAHGERCSIIGCDNFIDSESDVKICNLHLQMDLTNNYVECAKCLRPVLKNNALEIVSQNNFRPIAKGDDIEIVGQNNLCFACVKKLMDNPGLSIEFEDGVSFNASQLTEKEFMKIKPSFTENAVDYNDTETSNEEGIMPLQPSEYEYYKNLFTNIDWESYDIIGKDTCSKCGQNTAFVRGKALGIIHCANCLNNISAPEPFDPGAVDSFYDISGATGGSEWSCPWCENFTYYALINNTKYCISCGSSEDGHSRLKEKEPPEDPSKYKDDWGEDESENNDNSSNNDSSNNNTSVQQPTIVAPEQCAHSTYPVPNTVVFGDITEKTHKQVWTCIGCNSQQIVEYDHTYINGSCVCGALEDVEIPTITIIGFEETENVINVEPGTKIYLTLSDNKELKSITYKWFVGTNSSDTKSEPLEGKERTLYVGELTEEGSYILCIWEVIDAAGNNIKDKTYTFNVGQKEEQGNGDITDTVKPTIEILGVDGFGKLEENTTTVITLERSRDIRFKVSDDKGLSSIKYNYYATGKNQNKDLKGKVEVEEKIYIDPALDDNILSLEIVDLAGNKVENVTIKFKPAVENDDKENPKIKLITPVNGVEAEENSVVKIMFTDNKGLDTVTWTKIKKLDVTGNEELPQTGTVSFNGALAYPLEVANISSGSTLKLGVELKDINGNISKGEYTIRLNSKGNAEVKLSGNADIYVEEDSELPIAWLVIPNDLEDTKEYSEQGLTFLTDFMVDYSKKFGVKFTDNKMLKEVKYTIKYNGSEIFHKTESLEGLKEASVIGITETINDTLRVMNDGDFIELWASITDMNNNLYGSTPYVKFSKIGNKLVVSRYYMNDEYATDIELTYPTENISEDSLFVAKFADKNGIESVSYEVKPTKNGEALKEFGTSGISGGNRLEINEMAITQVSDYDGVEIVLHVTDSNGMVTTKNYKFEIKNGVVTSHRYCELCKLYDCTIEHNVCPVCKIDGCKLDHTYCTSCRTHDCGITHEAVAQ